MPPRPVVCLIGTRPEAIKLAPVLWALKRAGLPSRIALSGQHVELLEGTLEELGIRPDETMSVKQPEQSLGALSARLLQQTGEMLARAGPEWLVVQGDTTTVAMGALAAYYLGIRVAHVEAGLRTGNRRNPFPEEVNRRLVACVGDLHFAPTACARQNLINEGVAETTIHVVGNTVVDALFHTRDELVPRLPSISQVDRILAGGRRLVLVTAHRRESFGSDLEAICRGIATLAEAFRDSVDVVFPVHLNPNVQRAVAKTLSGAGHVTLLPPLSYARFVQLLTRAHMVITDSGGVLEEAAALGIPVLVVRRETERPEAFEVGVAQLIPPDAQRLVTAGVRLLTDSDAYLQHAHASTVFGDGTAGERIVQVLTGTVTVTERE